jgi:hypothetical protein
MLLAGYPAPEYPAITAVVGLGQRTPTTRVAGGERGGPIIGPGRA